MTSAHPPAYGPVGTLDRMHLPRTRGAIIGGLLILLGIWGGIIPFVGPVFGYSYSPGSAWNFTLGRLWLEILPAAAVIVGGVCVLMATHRMVMVLGAWLAAAAGAWFVIGPVISALWNSGSSAGGVPVANGISQSVVEQIGYFVGLGVVVLFLAAFLLGRISVVGVRDVEAARASRPPGADRPRP